MKKIIYSLLFIGLLFTGCISYEEYSSESYGTGPSVEIAISAIQDSSFVATITPSAGAKYYSYYIDQNDATTDINAGNLISASYSGSRMVNATDTISIELTIDASPFTTYQIYAVASNDKGVLGEVSHQTVFTTDGETPTPMTFRQSTTNPALVQVVFSEAISRGAGEIRLTYIKQNDLLNQETVVLDDPSISISGDAVVFEAPDPTAGVWFAISWDKGAFVDVANNETPAFFSGLNSNYQLVGVVARIPVEAFPIEDENRTENAPYFANWQTFEVEYAFDFDIYPNNRAVKGGIQAIYSSSGKQTIIDLSPNLWTVSGNSLKIRLPEAPAAKDGVSFIINENVFLDVYGNPNDLYIEGDIAAYYDSFEKEDFLGTFQFTYASVYEDPEDIWDGGIFTIEEDPTVSNGVILKDFYLPGSEIEATYSLEKGKLYIPNLSIIGLESGYLFVIYNLEVEEIEAAIEVQIQGDRSLICPSMFGIVVADPATGELLGYWDQFIDATFTPIELSAAGSPSKVSSPLQKRQGSLHAASFGNKQAAKNGLPLSRLK